MQAAFLGLLLEVVLVQRALDVEVRWQRAGKVPLAETALEMVFLDARQLGASYLVALKECFVPSGVFGKSRGVSGLRPRTEACEDPPVECDVCGRVMWRWPVQPAVSEEEIWSCSWCHAATHVGGEWFEVSRPPYLPVEMRWERAVADGLSAGVSHAFGIFDTTLCGIQVAGMSPSDHGWLPDRENACGACREAAGAIDERWPQAMRAEDARVSVGRRL
ncbi:hypothetical protein JCM13580A_61910 [Streptomyces drozdowiczii]